MAWPYDELPLAVEMWTGTAWEDITDDVRAAEGANVVIARGQADEASSPEPGSITATLANVTGRYSPRNPNSDLYGKVGRNTPIRVRVTESHVDVDDQTRGYGEASEFPPRWDVSGVDATTSVTAQGILRRLGQGVRPLRSVMKSAVLSAVNDTPAYYWPFEDGTAATFLASGLSGGPSVAIVDSDHTFPGSDGRIAGSGAYVDLEAYQPDPTGSPNTWLLPQLSQVPLSGFAAGKVSFALAFTLDTTISASWELRIRLSGGTYDHLAMSAYAATTSGALTTTYGANLVLADSGTGGGAAFSSPSGSGYPNLFDGEPHTVLCTAEQSGADVLVSLQVDDAALLTHTYTGTTLGTPIAFVPTIPLYASVAFGGFDTGHGENLVVGLAHAAIWGTGTPVDLHPYADGLAGETAGDRASRLCNEIGVELTLLGAAAETAVMGPQASPATYADAFAETYVADDALLFESRSELGLTFRARTDLYNQAVALQLDHDADGEIAPDLEPTDDDQLIRNRVTVTRKSGDITGASATYEDSTSSLGTQSPPEGVGPYEDSVELNLETDDDLIHHAAWRVHIGTWDEARYPVVRINMTALAQQGKTDLIAAAAALDVGDRLRLINLPVWTGADGGTVDLLCLGFTETFDYPNGWTIEINTVPYGPYHVRQLAGDTADDLDGRYAGDDACAIRADITSSATSIAFDPNVFRWAANIVQDDFGRTSASGWGTPDVGPSWLFSGGGSSAVSGGAGTITLASADDVNRYYTSVATYADMDVWMRFTAPATATGDMYTVSAERVSDLGVYDHGYRAQAAFQTSGNVDVSLVSINDGTLATSLAVTTYSPGDVFVARLRVVGSALFGKVWHANVAEPGAWQVTATGADGSALLGAPGVRCLRSSANTNANLAIPVDWFFAGSLGTHPDDFPLTARLVKAPGIAGGGETVTVSQITTTEPTYVAAGAASHASNAAVTPALAAGLAQGDWIVVVGCARSSATLSISAGYTLLAHQGGIYVWARVRGSSSPSNPTVTPSGGVANETISAYVLGFRGMPTTLSLDEYVLDSIGQTNSSAQNIAYGSLQAGIYRGVVRLILARKSDDDTGIAPPTGFTEALDATTTTGDDQSVYAAYRIDLAPARVAAGSLTVTGGASAVSDSLVLALAGGYQTATVTRSANDVTKAHDAGTLLAVEDVLTLAL